MADGTSRGRRAAKFTVLALSIAWLGVIFWNSAKPLPPGTHAVSQIARLSESEVDFLDDSPPRGGSWTKAPAW